MNEFPDKLRKKLESRKVENALRGLTLSGNLADFYSNDYLGFAKDEGIFVNTLEILDQRNIKQNGATGSRLLSGNSVLHSELEELLGEFYRSNTALLFNSGYDANIGFFSSVPQRGDIIIYDELIHASIRDGIGLGNAKNFKFRHNDLDDLERLIGLNKNRGSNSEIYVVTESVFSMDGDSPALKTLAKICLENGCRLVVDEAHALGIFGDAGEGLTVELGLQDLIFARIATFGKAFGCHGAAILGGQDLKNYLINFARSFIYTTALPPHSLASLWAVHQEMNTKRGLERRVLLNTNVEHFRHQLHRLDLDGIFVSSESAIQCCIIPGNEKVKKISKGLIQNGFDVRPILSPTVKKGKERLRFCIHSYNTEEEITSVLGMLKKSLE